MDITKLLSQLDCMLVAGKTEAELYRKLNTLQSHGRGGWRVLKTPQWVNGRLVIVLIRESRDT